MNLTSNKYKPLPLWNVYFTIEYIVNSMHLKFSLELKDLIIKETKSHNKCMMSENIEDYRDMSSHQALIERTKQRKNSTLPKNMYY